MATIESRKPYVFMEPEVQTRESETVAVSTLMDAVWEARRAVLVGLLIGAILFGGLAFWMQPIYRAQVVSVPVRRGGAGGLSDNLGQFAGLAALAGVDVHGQDNLVENLEFLKSRSLAQDFITENNLLPVLFPRLWDAQAGKWRVGPDEVPTMSAAVRKFNKAIRTISEDKRTNVVTISIDWRDRRVAVDWANRYLELANRQLGRRAISDAQATLNYLSREVDHTTSLQVQQALYHLIEEQQKTIALANTRTEFAFKFVDRATLPELNDYVRPNRPLFIFGGALLGFLIGLAVSRIRRKRRGGRHRAVE